MLARLFWHWLILAFGLYLLTLITPMGISYDKPADLAWAALVLIVFNTILKPILVFFTLPLVLFTLGLFLFVINAIILYLVPHFVSGFHVPSFLAAFLGALLLSLITGLFSGWEKSRPARRYRSNSVIDI